MGEALGPGCCERTREGLRVHVLAQPRDAFVGVHQGRLKVALKAPPVDGEASAALLAFRARAPRVPKRALSPVQGESSRRKTVRVEGAPDDSEATLAALLAKT